MTAGINPHFTKRGTVTIRSLKSGMAHFTPEGKLSEGDVEKLQVGVVFVLCKHSVDQIDFQRLE